MLPILQDRLPHAPWSAPHTARLPGIQPAEPESWIVQDEAFAGQMAERDRLIATQPNLVHDLRPEAREGAGELLGCVLDILSRRAGYDVEAGTVTRPDGVVVLLDVSNPLLTLGRLVQEDLCILTSSPNGHVLSGAVLCFPASWTLSEKIGRPMVAIHNPVDSYDDTMARRVQRLFDVLRPEAPLWRSNALIYQDPTLFQPRSELFPRQEPEGQADYIRSERQTLVKLPLSGVTVFAIHTVVVHKRALTDEQRTGLEELEVVAGD